MNDVDAAAAAENYNEIVNTARMGKTRAYFASPKSMHELVVYFAILDVVDDHLLFPFLGDALQECKEASGISKLELVLHPTESKIAKCFNALLEIINWTIGGACRRPWCLLYVAHAPLDDQSFLRWCRSQVARMSSALFRRYEVRFSTWPYKLFKLVCLVFFEGERASVINSLLESWTEELDVYSRASSPCIRPQSC